MSYSHDEIYEVVASDQKSWMKFTKTYKHRASLKIFIYIYG